MHLQGGSQQERGLDAGFALRLRQGVLRRPFRDRAGGDGGVFVAARISKLGYGDRKVVNEHRFDFGEQTDLIARRPVLKIGESDSE